MYAVSIDFGTIIHTIMGLALLWYVVANHGDEINNRDEIPALAPIPIMLFRLFLLSCLAIAWNSIVYIYDNGFWYLLAKYLQA